MGDLSVRQFEQFATQRISLNVLYYRNVAKKQLIKKAASCVNELLIDYGLSGVAHTIARGEHMFLVCNSNQRIICELWLAGEYGVMCLTRKGYLKAKTINEAVNDTAKLKTYRKDK